MSCRRWEGKYPDLSRALAVEEGTKITIPKGLPGAVAKARMFVDDKIDVSSVSVELRKNRLRLRGEGPDGWYEELQEIDYGDAPLRFSITPQLLLEVCNRTDRCVVGKTKLKVVTKQWEYASCLAAEVGDG